MTTSWRVRAREIPLDRPRLLGILNVTPDSFSDGGAHFRVEAAVAHAERMLAEGADLIDIGGESTRPGATPIGEDEERARVLPVLRELLRRHPDAVLSVDTVKSAVAEAALGEGAHVVNDVSAFRLDPRMGEICARGGAGVILMHSRGTVSEMASYVHAEYADVVAEVVVELGESIRVALRAGVARESIAVDPGVGFAKRGAQSLRVLAELPAVERLGHPIVVGVSRKRFIGEITGVPDAAERVHGTSGALVLALTRGARLFRVHDVGAARQALDVAWAIMNVGGAP